MTDLLDTPVAAHPPAGAGRRTPDMVPGRVGVIGSRSSTNRVHVSLTRDADEQGLVGSMVVVRKDFPSGDTELGLGVVEDVETRNAAHEQIATVGMVTNLVSLERSPGGADVLQAVVDVQAVYQRDVDGQVTPKGSALSTSPRTGTIVDRLGEADLTDIADAAGGASVYALGDIYRMPGLPLPMNTDHYDTPMGSSHAGVFGSSGAGKSILASYFTAAQMRHDDLGVLVIDPQGQFTTEQGMEFSLQGFASGLGRQVKVASLLGEVQLDKNKDLFARLLGKTKFFTPYLFTQNNDNVGHAVEQVKKALDQVGTDGNDWTTADPGALLEAILDRFEAAVPFIYSSESAAENFRAKIELHRTDLHTGDGSSCDLLPSLRAVLGLFRPGRGKVAEKNLFSHLFARNPGLPRGMVVLNMVPEDPSMDIDMRERLGGDDTKALLLGHLMHRLEKEAERRFQTPTIDPETGRPRLLNTMVLFDEAARYAPRQPDNDDVARLAKSLSRYAKEMRKYGVGFNYILQEPKDLDLGVWTQLSSGFRIIGYGLGGASMSMVKEYLPSEGKDSGRLYRSFPSPRSTGEFNFMVLGGVSPLSMSNAPLYLSAFTSFEQFADANPWIPQSAITGATSGLAGGKPAPVEAAAPDDDDAFDDLGDDPLPF